MNKQSIHILIPIITLIVGGLVGFMIWGNNSESVHSETEIHAQHNSDEIWTCSMHPQIRQNEPGICPICEMDLIPLDNSMGNDDPTILKMSVEAAKLAQVETFTVGGDTNTNQSQSQLVQVDGTVELDERTIKSQTAHIAGRIETMAISFEGQYVSAGQKIASIYSTDILGVSQELLTAASFDDRVEGLQNAAIQKLKNWKISDTQIQEILSSGKPIETIDIYADHSGYVLQKNSAQGDYVKQGQSLFTIGSTARLWLIFSVFESDLQNVKKGNKITFTTPSIPNKNFDASITFIQPILNRQSRTATIRAEINNPGNLLKPGMLLSGKIATNNQQSNKISPEQILVPNTAILWTGSKSVVYVQLPDYDIPTYQFREVSVDNRSDQFSTISSGIENGDQVVVHGAFAVDAAAQLNNNMSMMNRNVTIKQHTQAESHISFVNETPAKFQSQLDIAAGKYMILKDALVASDEIQARESATEFLDAVTKMDMTLLKGEAHMFWMEQFKALQSHGQQLSEASDILQQRNQFDFLSQAMISSLKAFGTKNQTYFLQHCPMVKDNQGADWLSMEEQIKNPYFGDKMMKCGSVKLKIN